MISSWVLQRTKKCMKNSFEREQNNILIIIPKGFKLQKTNFLFVYPQSQNFNFKYKVKQLREDFLIMSENANFWVEIDYFCEP
jgi:hypothetical protein